MNKRVQAFLDKMQEKELDGIIINNLKNVYYLTGFWGSHGTVFISLWPIRNGGRGSEAHLYL